VLGEAWVWGGAGRGRTFRVRFQRFPRLRVLLQGTKRELQVLARRVPRAQLERDRFASVQISDHECVGWRFRSLGRRRAACLPAPSDLSALGWVVLAIVLLNYRGRLMLLRALPARLLLPSGQPCPGSSASGKGLETGDGSRLYLRGPSGSEHPHACLYPNGRNDLLTGKLPCDVAILRPGVWQVGDVDGVEARSRLRLVLLEEERHLPQGGCCAAQPKALPGAVLLSRKRSL